MDISIFKCEEKKLCKFFFGDQTEGKNVSTCVAFVSDDRFRQSIHNSFIVRTGVLDSYQVILCHCTLIPVHCAMCTALSKSYEFQRI